LFEKEDIPALRTKLETVRPPDNRWLATDWKSGDEVNQFRTHTFQKGVVDLLRLHKEYSDDNYARGLAFSYIMTGDSSFAQKAKDRGFQVIIAAAGMSAHLAGVVAAHTTLPVIGVPLEGKLEGLDALLSTVQMPRGIPVGTVTIGKTGFVNAALLAAEILALSDKKLENRLKKYREKMTQEVLRADKRFRKKR